MSYSIVVENLTKKFGDFTAVDNVSFKVEKGEIFGFLGANGAGKSTTIRMLCGLLEPTTGDAVVGGFSIVEQPDKVKQSIGYMSQRFSLYNDLTIEENIDFFGGVYGLEGKRLEERKKWALEISDLKGKENVLTGDLPGGIKQRLALGVAVIHKPEILFLDEPTSGVDPISRRNFWDLINRFSGEGTTVLVTTHYLEEAEYCNDIILINAGRLIAEGNPQKLKTDYLDGNVFEIETDAPVELMEILKNAEFVIDVSIFGKKIHVITEKQYRDAGAIEKYCNLKDVKVDSITRIVPTLEDVFIHLLERGSKHVQQN
ncbi:ABC-type transport system ATPase component [Melioribacter roseus P3M-2]|uniref:ABC-type transport system ATPase component n=1 Tax=Melioribacter roseus (strain DSM 23840 / JCM 17771 / VKM B-2668 / P3M-2) TaxID=1191523 RepID=I7A2M3_MELRP|nr:ABC transporter ATP-binding protein [Melioribacter roseus]AFN74181.1 ABC-type transport system ATPase component [Melioribacter roseus P3M-2]